MACEATNLFYVIGRKEKKRKRKKEEKKEIERLEDYYHHPGAFRDYD